MFFKLLLEMIYIQQLKKKLHIYYILLLKIILLLMGIKELGHLLLYGFYKELVLNLEKKLLQKP